MIKMGGRVCVYTVRGMIGSCLFFRLPLVDISVDAQLRLKPRRTRERINGCMPSIDLAASRRILLRGLGGGSVSRVIRPILLALGVEVIVRADDRVQGVRVTHCPVVVLVFVLPVHLEEVQLRGHVLCHPVEVSVGL